MAFGNAAGMRTNFSVSAPVDDAVRDAFSIFRTAPGREWAREFLFAFDNDPGADIAGVEDPTAFDASTVYRGMTVVEAPAGVETGGEAAAENTYLLAPAWSKDGITVGYAIERVRGVRGYDSIHSLPNANEAPMWTVGRFVTDNRGETLVVGSASFTSLSVGKRPTVGIKHFRVISSTQRKQVFVHCDKAALLRKAHLGPTPLAFAQTALLFQGVVQDRPCIICGCEPRSGAPCQNRCPLPFELPNSGRDFARLKRNYNYYYGKFGGVSQVYMRPSLRMPFVSLRFYSSMLNRSVHDPGLCSRMKTLAIQDRMKQHCSIGQISFDFSTLTKKIPILQDGELMASSGTSQRHGSVLTSDDVANFLAHFARSDWDDG